MSPGFNEWLARRAVGWYPRRWQERYADEVLDVLDQHRVSARTVLNLAANAAAARLDPTYRQEGPPVLNRLRTGLTVLVVLTAFFGLLVGVRLLIGEETAFGVTGAHGIAVSGDGNLVATSSGAVTVRLWNITDPRHPVRLSTFDGGTFLAVSPDAHTLAIIGDQIKLWNITDPTRPALVATLPDYTRHAGGMAFSPDSRTLAVPYNGTVLVYDVTDPAQPRQLTPTPLQPTNDTNHDAGVSWFSPDGRLLAIKSGDSDHVTLWNVTDRSAPRSLATIAFGHDVPPFGVLAFSPDGAALATGTVHGHLTLWNITDPANPTISSTMDDVPIGEHVTGATVGIALAFSPDGHTLTSITGSIKSTRWDVTDRTRGRYLNERSRTDAGPGNFRLTPDAQAVVGAAHGADTITVWTLD